MFKYLIDLHVHTKKYSPCAELLDPDKIINEINKKKIHGVVITEHDILWSEKEIKEINKNLNGKKIYRGVEISSSVGHLVVIGLNNLEGIKEFSKVEKIIEICKKSNAVIILAHHHRKNKGFKEVVKIDTIPDNINAIEVISTVTKGENQKEAEKIAKKRGWIKVAGSDAHALLNIGKAVTAFKIFPKNEKELAKLIINGKCKPLRLN